MKRLLLIALCAICMAWVAAAQPAIATDGVQNGGSYSKLIAQGSIFIVKGTGLCPAGYMKVSAYPVPLTLNGVSITFTPVSGGTTKQAYMVYTYNIGGVVQIAGLLPSDTVPGDYNVTVSYNGTSAPQKVTVVDRTFGIVTADSSGMGPAQATDPAYALNRFTTGKLGTWNIKPAHPGETVTLWGTGIGADLQSDSTGGTSGNQTATAGVTVSVGSATITPGYAGRASGNAGTDQINIKLPTDVQTGCAIPIQVKTAVKAEQVGAGRSASAGSASNIVTIAIAKTGASACESSSLTAAQLAKLDAGGSLVYGNWDLSSNSTSISMAGISFSSTTDTAGGEFTQFTSSNIASLAGTADYTQIGSCTVFKGIGNTGVLSGGAPAKLLDAGNMSISVPQGVDVPLDKSADFAYSTTLASTTSLPFPLSVSRPRAAANNYPLTPGSYTFRGSGGASVNAFNTAITIPTLFVWSNMAATTQVTIGGPLPITWTGGDPPANVIITGSSGACVSNCDPNSTVPAVYDFSVFTCIAKVRDGSFTVPGSVTGQMYPADPATGGLGLLLVDTTPSAPNTFIATLTPAAGGGNIDQGVTTYSMGASTFVPYK
jgi:uncharacterized protein (TIGR03437 family)